VHRGGAVLSLHRAGGIQHHREPKRLSCAATDRRDLHRDAHEIALLERGMGRLLDATGDFFRHRRSRIAVVECVVEFLGTDPVRVRHFSARQGRLSQTKGDIADV
jgi:hypothetical protein